MATETRLSMSPGWLAPISMTAILVSGVMLRSDRGTPISLLRFPRVAVTLYFTESTALMSSLVVVLPFVPVSAMTGSLLPSTVMEHLCVRASSFRVESVSSTGIILLSFTDSDATLESDETTA